MPSGRATLLDLHHAIQQGRVPTTSTVQEFVDLTLGALNWRVVMLLRTVLEHELNEQQRRDLGARFNSFCSTLPIQAVHQFLKAIHDGTVDRTLSLADAYATFTEMLLPSSKKAA